MGMSGAEPRDAISWHALTADEALDETASSRDGLPASVVATRLATWGPNELEHRGGPGVFALLLRQFNNPIVYLLVSAAVLAFVLGKLTDGAVVLGAIVVNVAIGFLQEFRAGRAIEALSRMVPHDATVVREGQKRSVPASMLVPGDIVHLASGDRVPADIRLLHVKNLAIDEAALTGESVPVAKSIDPVDEDSSIGDRTCLAFGGTLTTTGAGEGVVVATGQRTELGRISELLREAAEVATPLTRAISKVGTWLTVAVVVVSAVLLGIALARGYGLTDALLVAITLAVASVPEGLPAIITIALAIGVQRMAHRHAIIRKLPSVETLGSTTVICTDKTGTLTRNEMTVQVLCTPRGSYTLTGVGYAPRGTLATAEGRELDIPPDDVHELVVAGALCNDAALLEEHGHRVAGDPTEGALLVAAEKVGCRIEDLRRAWPRLDTMPFESEHQFMATLHGRPTAEGGRVLLKGAPEVVLPRCSLGSEQASRILDEVHRLASRGMRVLAFAQSFTPPGTLELAPTDVERELSFLGLQGMIDPPRPEAIDAVRACHQAGITVKMITGDHLGTANAIGAELGLIEDGSTGASGRDLAALDPEQLRRVALETNVFARVAPEQKLSLVRALQTESQIVAMTGDGVNDAPALKQANVGVAMGITGTAVSKEAADVVLADDNFATIAAAVEEGRRIYDNLVKSLAFVLPTNLGLGLILIVAVLLFPFQEVAGQLVPLMPARPTQLLWINLVAAVALSLPLAFEVQERDVMRRPPRRPDAPVFGGFVMLRTLTTALLMSAGAVGLFWWEYSRELGRVGHEVALREAQTMVVTTVVLFQVFYLFNCRSLKDPIRKIGLFSNPSVFLGVGTLLVLQAGFIYLPFMQEVFGTAALGWDALALSAAVAAVILPVVSVEKLVRRAGRRDETAATRPPRTRAALERMGHSPHVSADEV